MANTISLSVDLSLTEAAVLNDLTTFTSPLRNTVGVFVTAYKVNAKSQQTEIVITSNSGSPATATKWNFNIGTDGWYQFYYISVPNYDAGVSYAQYDVAHASGNVYRSLVGSNGGNAVSNPLYWELLPNPTLIVENVGLPTATLNADIALYQRVLIPKVTRLYGDRAVQIARECCSDCEIPEHVDQFEIVFSLREGALISEQRLEYADGERMTRRLDEFV